MDGMKKPRVAIVNCFVAWKDRLDMVIEYFEGKGYEVNVIHSNFDHMQKIKFSTTDSRYKMIDVKPYYKNMSLKRIVSHIKFSKDAFKEVALNDYKIVYVFAPPNYLIKEAAQYKKKKCNDNVIAIDLIDMWPESIPLKMFRNNFFFKLWSGYRDSFIDYADIILTECDYYFEILQAKMDARKHYTLHWASKDYQQSTELPLCSEPLYIAYLGSINNIIDIDLIIAILTNLKKNRDVVFEIVGDGEKRNLLLSKLINHGIKYNYHGKVYDPEKKKLIFDKCHYALNIMKDNVKVGLTMKSIDYFRYELPIINSIPGDTYKLINDYGIGLNIDRKNLNYTINELLRISTEDLRIMKANTHIVYKKFFSEDAFIDKLDSAFSKHI